MQQLGQFFIQHPLWLYVIGVNAYTFVLMGYDKRQAIHHKWRISERHLLVSGAIGGGIGGLLGRSLFHHKTRKSRFFITFLIGCLVAGLLSWL